MPPDFRERMRKVAGPFLSRGHGERFDAVLWIDRAANGAWESGDPMPEGTLLLEETFVRDSGESRPSGLLVMLRQASAWRYVSIGDLGEVTSDERVAGCAECHKQGHGEVFAYSSVYDGGSD